MTTQTLARDIHALNTEDSGTENAGDDAAASDPFDFDITFIEGVDASETVLMCGTGDNCGSSCGSACVTS